MKGWSLNGYRAVVTGGAAGIGRAIVDELLAHGASVVSVDLQAGKASPGARECVADVSTEAGRKSVLDSIPADWESVDILVNNAGTNNRKPTVDFTLADYELVQRTNATSMHELCRLFHPGLKRSGRASIVNISSVAGLMSVGSSAAYAMTKAAALQLSKYLAVEWAKDQIRVNAVAPGWVATSLTDKIQKSERAMKVIEERTPLGRIGQPHDIAAVVAFLCMPVAGYLTGAIIPVDGAMSCYAMDITAALRDG